MKGQYLISTGFKSIRKHVVLHCSLFNDINLVAKDPLKLYNPINILLKNFEYLKWHIYQ